MITDAINLKAVIENQVQLLITKTDYFSYHLHLLNYDKAVSSVTQAVYNALDIQNSTEKQNELLLEANQTIHAIYFEAIEKSIIHSDVTKNEKEALTDILVHIKNAQFYEQKAARFHALLTRMFSESYSHELLELNEMYERLGSIEHTISSRLEENNAIYNLQEKFFEKNTSSERAMNISLIMGISGILGSATELVIFIFVLGLSVTPALNPVFIVPCVLAFIGVAGLIAATIFATSSVDDDLGNNKISANNQNISSLVIERASLTNSKLPELHRQIDKLRANMSNLEMEISQINGQMHRELTSIGEVTVPDLNTYSFMTRQDNDSDAPNKNFNQQGFTPSLFANPILKQNALTPDIRLSDHSYPHSQKRLVPRQSFFNANSSNNLIDINQQAIDEQQGEPIDLNSL